MVALGQFTLNETSQTNKGNFWILSSGKGKFYVGLPPLKGLKGTQRDSEGLRERDWARLLRGGRVCPYLQLYSCVVHCFCLFTRPYEHYSDVTMMLEVLWRISTKKASLKVPVQLCLTPEAPCYDLLLCGYLTMCELLCITHMFLQILMFCVYVGCSIALLLCRKLLRLLGTKNDVPVGLKG